MREKPSRRHSRKQYNNLIPLEAKTPNQKEYIKNIVENDVIFCSGPSGSGKSFVASGIAAHHLHAGDIEKIIITRPLVCSGKDVGSLPGELFEKNSSLSRADAREFKIFFDSDFLWTVYE